METFILKQTFHSLRRVIAKAWLGLNERVQIIGVTGSYGKTNTVRAITEVLNQKYKTLQTDINLDTIYNLPITILKLRPEYQKLVLEYGVDHKGEMDFHLSLAKPSIAVVTGISPVHSDKELLGSLEGIIKEKQKLIRALSPTGLAVLNWDDENVRKMIRNTSARIIKYSIKTDKAVDYWADKIKVGISGTLFTVNHGNEKFPVRIKLVGRHFVQACLAAVAVGFEDDLTVEQIKVGLGKLQSIKGRANIEEGPFGTILINDALRANPASVIAGLDLLTELSTKGKRVAILGEMGELGEVSEEEHKKIGKKIAGMDIDFYLGVGPLQKLVVEQAIKVGFSKSKAIWVEDVFAAADILKQKLKSGDLIYLKGSLLRHMERIIMLLEDKTVGCRVVKCHSYNQCPDCQHLASGLN